MGRLHLRKGGHVVGWGVGLACTSFPHLNLTLLVALRFCPLRNSTSPALACVLLVGSSFRAASSGSSWPAMVGPLHA